MIVSLFKVVVAGTLAIVILQNLAPWLRTRQIVFSAAMSEWVKNVERSIIASSSIKNAKVFGG